MKNYKFISRLSKQTKFSKDNIIELREGIKKRLLKKYKPKENYNIKAIEKTSSQKISIIL